MKAVWRLYEGSMKALLRLYSDLKADKCEHFSIDNWVQHTTLSGWQNIRGDLCVVCWCVWDREREHARARMNMQRVSSSSRTNHFVFYEALLLRRRRFLYSLFMFIVYLLFWNFCWTINCWSYIWSVSFLVSSVSVVIALFSFMNTITPTHAVVPGFPPYENTCLYEQVLPATPVSPAGSRKDTYWPHLCNAHGFRWLHLPTSPPCSHLSWHILRTSFFRDTQAAWIGLKWIAIVIVCSRSIVQHHKIADCIDDDALDWISSEKTLLPQRTEWFLKQGLSKVCHGCVPSNGTHVV